MISSAAQKLLDWFKMYQITPTEYEAQLPPTAQRRGEFANALEELVDYEDNYGYFDLTP